MKLRQQNFHLELNYASEHGCLVLYNILNSFSNNSVLQPNKKQNKSIFRSTSFLSFFEKV